LAEQLEELGRAAEMNDVDAIVAELGTELKRCHQALRSIAGEAERPDSASTVSQTVG
jgi:hypothetical protein